MRRLRRLSAIALFVALSMETLANSLSEGQRRTRLEALRTGISRDLTLTPLERFLP
jgi:hypothetical protein